MEHLKCLTIIYNREKTILCTPTHHTKKKIWVYTQTTDHYYLKVTYSYIANFDFVIVHKTEYVFAHETTLLYLFLLTCGIPTLYCVSIHTVVLFSLIISIVKMKSSPLLTTIVLAMILLPGISASLGGNNTDLDVINTVIEDLIVLEDIVVINWTPLNYSDIKHYVLEYKQINEQTFQNVVFPMSVVSAGSPRLQHGIEYVFQVYGVLIINSVECESEKSPPVSVLITNDNSSQCDHIGLIASVAVLSTSLLLVIIILTVVVIKKVVSKKIKVPQERVVESNIEILYENVEFKNNIHNAVYERREGIVTPQQENTTDEIIYEPMNTDVVLRI